MPTLLGGTLFVGFISLGIFMFLLMSRLLPIVSIWETHQSILLTKHIKFYRTEVYVESQINATKKILSEKQINAELLNGNLATPKWYFPVMGVLGIGVVIGFITILYMFNRGLGWVYKAGLLGFIYNNVRILGWD